MTEHDRLPTPPILVVNLDAIVGRDRRHDLLPRQSGTRASGGEQLSDTAHECDRQNSGWLAQI
jgi:hypothetical protein